MSREAVLEIEKAMQASNEPRPGFPTAHHFANGVYAREVFIPQGSIVTGKVHRYEALNVLTMGMLKVYNPEQPEMDKIYQAPFTFVSPANSKRCVYAITDCIWMVIHPAESKDLGKLEDELIMKDYPETLEDRAAAGL